MALPKIDSRVTSDPPPTGVRHVVVAVATLMSLLLYLDRFCLSFAVDYIREDLRLTQTKISWLLSAFSWTYALAQVPSGWLSDRFGPRRMLVIYILGWSIFTALIGVAYSFALLVFMRLGIGAAQAGAYPSCGTLLSRWIPVSRRASASSLVAFGGRVGGAIAPMLTAFLIVWFVPSDAPLQFAPRDLLDPVSLSRKLTEASAAKTTTASPAAHVWSLLPEEAQQSARRILERESAAKKEAGKATAEIPEADLAALAEGINAVMNREDLYDPAPFANVTVNREAQLVQKKLQGSESTAAVAISSAERFRFHRFLLEASFPTELSKLYTRSWRPVMVVYGLAGFFVAAIFWIYFRDDPSQHPGCNESERALIREGRVDVSSEAAPPSEPFPARALLTNFSMWCMCLLQFGTNVGWFFMVSWLPRYLYEVHHVPALARGFMASVPIWVGMIGLLVGGRLTDWLTGVIGLRWGRKLPMVTTRLIGALGYILALVFTQMPADSPLQTAWAYTIAFSLVTLGVDMGIAPTWAFMQDVGGRNVGAILGWGNMWGNFGAALAPPLYNWVLGETPGPSEWQWLFGLCLAACLLSALGALGVDATRPLSTARSETGPADER